MIRLVKQRSAALIFGGVLLMTVLLLRTGTSWAHQEGEEAVHDRKLTHEKYLFVWAGDQSRSNPDFLAVINFDEHSSHYGGVIHTVPLPGPGATGNEPHHVGLSKDETVLATGGLLSVLKGPPEFFSSMSPIPRRLSSSPRSTQHFPRSPMISNRCPTAAFW